MEISVDQLLAKIGQLTMLLEGAQQRIVQLEGTEQRIMHLEAENAELRESSTPYCETCRAWHEPDNDPRRKCGTGHAEAS